MYKNNRKLQILYKCIKTNASAIWQHMLHIPPKNTHLLTAQKTNQEPHKRAYISENGGLGEKKLGEWTKSRKG